MTNHLPLSHFTAVQKRFETVSTWAKEENAFGAIAAQTVDLIINATDPTSFLDAIHRLQRVYLTGFLDLCENPGVLEALTDPRFQTWKDYKSLAATEEQKKILARLMYEGDPERRHPIFLVLSDYARDVGELIMRRCVDDAADVDPWFADALFHRRLMANLDLPRVVKYAEYMAIRRERCKRLIASDLDQNNAVFFDPPGDPEMYKEYSNASELRAMKYSNGLFYTSTRLPTPAGALVDGLDYQEYVELFFRMCAVDWSKIDVCHKFLIGKLNAAKTLRLTNNDGTDLTMDIEGFTFVNSRVAKNVPGSEVFSAPRRDSVNGIIVAKGLFAEKISKKPIRDITLEFENGRIVRYDAAEGLEHLQQAIETDDGSRYIGEIGIGTNPELKRHIINSLLVEKIGGSFHVAIGRAYEYKDYLGEPVLVDNGNRSKIHWDVTTMLYGKEGRMILDGVSIMEDGKFTDPELSYLNGNT